MKSTKLLAKVRCPAFFAMLFCTTYQASAQVKIGTNPNSISPDVHLDMEAANGYHTVATKNGKLGVNTTSPTSLLHVSASEPSEGLLVDVKDASSSVKVVSDGALIVSRNGTAKTWAPHVGGFIDILGLPSSTGWRFAQYTNFLGISKIDNGNLVGLPFYISNDEKITMGSTYQVPGAKLTVSGGSVAADGFAIKNGIYGVAPGNTFNVSFDNVRPHIWIDNLDFGPVATTSDYRLKKNVKPAIGNAIERVSKLRPVSFEYKDLEGGIFKSDAIVHEGFIAHELQEIIPSAVSGKKDGLTSEGKIQPQTLNSMPLISLLTKAVQEQQAEIEAIKSENQALKAQVQQMDALVARLVAVESKLQVSSNDGETLVAGK